MADSADPDFSPYSSSARCKPADDFYGSSSQRSASLAPSRRSSRSTQSLLDLGQVQSGSLLGGSALIEATDPAWNSDSDDWLDGIEIATPRMQYEQTVEFLAGIDVDLDEVSTVMSHHICSCTVAVSETSSQWL